MLSIERLRLQLPAGFEGRAAAIVRRLGDELAAQPDLAAGGRLERLRLPPLRIEAGADDATVARAVAVAIRQGLEGGR